MTHTNSLDPTIVRSNSSRFELERIYDAKVFDKEGNPIPVIISFWNDGNEIREVKVLVRIMVIVEFSDLYYDVEEAIRKRYSRAEIVGEIEVI